MPAATAPTERKHSGLIPFKPGQSGNPAGRKPGSRNKLGEAFIEALYDDFNAHGVEAIKTVRDQKPDQYLKVVASILPKEIEAGEKLGNILEDILERVDGRTRTIKPTFEIVG
jgi:hypothetical protein